MHILKVFACTFIFIIFIARLSFSETILSFEGQMNFKEERLQVKLKPLHFLSGPSSSVGSGTVPSLIEANDDKSAVVLKAEKTSKNEYRLLFNIEHLRTPLFDISSQIESRLRMSRSSENKNIFLEGDVSSQYSLIDFEPINEFNGRFVIADSNQAYKKLIVPRLSFGNVTCQGVVDLKYPFKIDLVVNLNSVLMKDFLGFWVRNKKHDSSGIVSGKIKVLGDLSRVILKGDLESYDGHIKKLSFNNIHLNIGGVYPHMKITDSTLSKADGLSVSFDGPFNLADRKNFKKQLKALTLAPLIKESGLDSEWTIRRSERDDQATTELKYLLRKEKGFGDTGPDSLDVLGIERTMEF